jgi:hypothetical protein
MLVMACLTCLFTSCHILAHDYLLVILYWSLVRIHSCFASLDTRMCIITEILACMPCETPYFWILCIVSHSYLDLCLMSSLPKGERLYTKLVELFANWVVERKNMIVSI